MSNVILFVALFLHVFTTTSLVLFLDKKVKKLDKQFKEYFDVQEVKDK